MNHHTRRNSLRYLGYDYAQPGSVYVTICTHANQRLFGDVADARMHLSPAGSAALVRWKSIPQRFPGILIDAHILMPDHLHGIIHTGTDPSIEDAPTVGHVIRWFKNAVHADYRKGVRNQGWPPYAGLLWHHDYYDHIIADDADLARIRDYIAANPARWHHKRTGSG